MKPTPCAQCPLKSLNIFRAIAPEEFAFIEWFKVGEFVADEGSSILLEGSNSPHLYTVLDGWAFRYKTLPDGRRQILNFALPGDFIGLQSSIFNEMQHSVEALTKIVLCVFPRDRLFTLYNKHPSLAFDLTWLASRQERLLDETLLSVGRRSAAERMANALLTVFYRTRQLGLAQGNRVRFPFTQTHVADALGLSLVHTNKTLQSLTKSGAMRWKDGVFELADEKLLKEIASYDPDPTPLRPLI